MSSSSRFVLPYQSVFDAAAVPIPGALLGFFLTGTSTPSPTYSDAALSTENANPVEALDNGLFPNIFLDPSIIYKVALTGPDDGINPPDQIWTADPVAVPVSAGDVIYPAAFSFLGGSPPLAAETMGMHTLTSDVDFGADFSGSWGFFRVAATADYTAQIVDQNNASLGTMHVSAGQQVPSFTTNGSQPLSLTNQTTIIVLANGSPDATLADGSWTLAGRLHTS